MIRRVFWLKVMVLVLLCLVEKSTPGGLLQESGAADGTTRNMLPDSTRFESVFLLSLQGGVSKALSLLDSLDDSSLTSWQRETKRKYYARFRWMNEIFEHRTNDSVVAALINLYQTYWRRVLLDNQSSEKYDSILAEDVFGFLQAHGTDYDVLARDDFRENLSEHVQDFLGKRGIYAAAGRTGSLYDLLLHARESDTIFDVRTPEEHINVKVVFMDDLISNGWEEFATFGRYFPGGWATDEALYCARETYDLESENFEVSYLMHEGKHFADYKRFPKLTSADLEYRAKLVELSAAQESMYKLLQFFSKNSVYDRQNPHAYANYCVLRDLSNAIQGVGTTTDMPWWQTVSTVDIHTRAAELLKKNTAALMRCGADTVTSFIK